MKLTPNRCALGWVRLKSNTLPCFKELICRNMLHFMIEIDDYCQYSGPLMLVLSSLPQNLADYVAQQLLSPNDSEKKKKLSPNYVIFKEEFFFWLCLEFKKRLQYEKHLLRYLDKSLKLCKRKFFDLAVVMLLTKI